MELPQRTILIADDDASVRRTLVLIARRQQLRVEEADNPKVAMERVDVVDGALIDGFRCGDTFSGVDVYRACDVRQKIAMMLTADSDLPDLLIKLGIPCLKKPPDLQDLVQFFRKIRGDAA